MMTVFTELGALYADPDAELPPVELTFRDYLTSVRPAPEALEADRAYWVAACGAPSAARAGSCRARPAAVRAHARRADG